MDKMNKTNHLLGRIFLGIAIVLILAVPVAMAIILEAMPNWGVIGSSMLGLIFFLLGGIVEVITYSPMLGTSGTYLGFITGNLVNLKVPCAVNARELSEVKHGSKEGEIVSTISNDFNTSVLVMDLKICTINYRSYFFTILCVTVKYNIVLLR